MKTIIFKKKWVNQMDNMNQGQREKCIIALYDFLHHGHMTSSCIMDSKVTEFMKDIAEDVKRDEERREKARQRREERRRQQTVNQNLGPAEQNNEQTASINSNNDDFKNNPSLYMFDGFTKYMLSFEGKKLSPVIPDGQSLSSILQRYRRWIVSKARSTEISKFNVFRDILNRNMSDILSVAI